MFLAEVHKALAGFPDVRVQFNLLAGVRRSVKDGRIVTRDGPD